VQKTLKTLHFALLATHFCDFSATILFVYVLAFYRKSASFLLRAACWLH